ncbi:MAG: hypothetical protein K8R56_10190 [Candidatus Eisenbacteria bacterium]|nr:hypothetical protein [Candidatus Eisenbacteria bacterium]
MSQTGGGAEQHMDRTLRVALSARGVGLVLVGLTLAFGVLGLLAEWLQVQGHPVALGFSAYFDPAHEGSLPEWYSATIDALGALVVLLFAWAEPRAALRWRWALMALLMAGLSAGEATAILDARLPWLDTLGVAPGAATTWVMRGGGALVLGVLLVQLVPLFRELGARRTWLAFGCGAVVILGQSGLGWLGGRMAEWYGQQSLAYLLAHVGEETLETLGAALFLTLALDTLLARGGLVVRRREPATRPVAP